MTAIEEVRAQYRPAHIKTLFVGESAPVSGKFFYSGNTPMFEHMKKAVESALGHTSNFLESFRDYGWYLDDLVLTPVNQLGRLERIARCATAQASLADRISNYRPRAIVCLLLGIEPFVVAAIVASGSSAARYAVPFPGNGQQARFQARMAQIIPKLPRLIE